MEMATCGGKKIRFASWRACKGVALEGSSMDGGRHKKREHGEMTLN